MLNTNRICPFLDRSVRITLGTSLLCIPLWIGSSAPCAAQEAALSAEAAVPAGAPIIPQQVRYAGKLTARSGESVEAAFRVYASAEGGEPLWSETQQVSVGADGSYSVLLGASTTAGLPQTVFAGGAARWIGVTVERGEEQERVLLSSVPYAMKSADAESLAGHAAAEFATKDQLAGLATKVAAVEHAAAAEPSLQTSIHPEATLGGSGMIGTVPLWTNTATLGNSSITESGSRIGINFAAPAATLEVGGGMTVHGTLAFPPGAPATSTHSSASQTFNFSASAWNSTTAAPVSSTYTMQAGPTGNNTATPNAIFYFNYQNGSSAPINMFTLNGNGVMQLPNATGGLLSNGAVSLAPALKATSTTASNSPLLEIGASAYSSSSSTAKAQTFAWQTQASGNDTATPTGSLALLFGENGAPPAATGFSIAPNGVITFASDQQFPIAGTGGGTITSVATTSPLTGSAKSGAVTIGLNTTTLETTLDSVYPQLGAANTFTESNRFTQPISFASEQNFPGTISGVTSTSPITATTTSGAVSLSLDTSALETTLDNIYPQLGTQNTYTASAYYQSYVMAEYGFTGYSTGEYVTDSAVLGITGSNSFGSQVYQDRYELSAGVWGDNSGNTTLGAFTSAGIVGTADDNPAGVFYNDSKSYPSVSAINFGSDGTGLFKTFIASSPTGTCGIGGRGDLTCTGQVKTLATTSGGTRQVETYAMQSPENWMEDFGSGLLHDGVAVVKIDASFAETVSETADYHVFLTPKGDSKGLYVINETATSFEVRESSGGTSSLSFDYRIVAKRRGYEAQRLTDVTEKFQTESRLVAPPRSRAALESPRVRSQVRKSARSVAEQPVRDRQP